MFVLTGCVHLLPSSSDTTETQWSSYAEAHQAFSSIVNGQTRLSEIQSAGFDVWEGTNIKTLSYLDVQNMFLSHPSLILADLPEGIAQCLEAQEECGAYLLSISRLDKERYGSFWADMFGFRKRVHETGWTYEVLLVVVDDIVVYALESGIPNIDKRQVEKNPLGPLEGIGGDALEKVGNGIF